MTRVPLLIFGSKGQRSRPNLGSLKLVPGDGGGGGGEGPGGGGGCQFRTGLVSLVKPWLQLQFLKE